MDGGDNGHIECKLLGPNGDTGNGETSKMNGHAYQRRAPHTSVGSATEEYNEPRRGTIDQKPANNYDYDEDIRTGIPTRVGIDGTTNVVSGMFIVANAAIGCGTLAFSNAFKEAGGLYVGIVMVFVCACLCGFSLLVCGYTSALCRASEFYELGKELLGTWAEVLLQVCVIVVNVSACTMYFIIIGDQLGLILARIFQEDDGSNLYCDTEVWYFNRKLHITISTFVVVFPFLLVKKVDFLKYPSLLSVGSMVYLMFAVVIKYFMEDEEKLKKVELVSGPDHFYDVLNAFPTILFGYQCMTNACPVHANLKKKTPNNWFIVTTGTVVICTFVYLPSAVCGYLTHGTNIASNFLKSYDPNDTSILIGQIGVMVSVMMTYPVLYFVTRNAFDPMYTNLRLYFDEHYDGMKHEQRRRIIEAVLWYLGTLLLALFIPNIGVAINFAGSITAFFYFVFPGLFLYVIGLKRREEVGEVRMRIMVVLGLATAAFGVILFLHGNYTAVKGVMASSSADPDFCSVRAADKLKLAAEAAANNTPITA